MAAIRAAVAILLQAAGLSALLVGSRDSPVAKVITLLTDLKAKVESEGQDEASAYDKFSCFCRDTTTTKSDSIMEGQDTIDSLSASIQEETALQATKETDVSERQAKYEADEKELQETTVRCAAEMAEFEATIADLTKAVSSLKGAMKALSASKPSALLALRAAARQLPALAAALGRVQDPKRRALLQHGVDPADPEYKFHSQGIITTLTDLTKEFEDNKATTEKERDIAKTSCDDMKKGLTDAMTANSEAMTKLKTEIEDLKTNIAQNREDLVQTESLLADDKLYLKDLTERCEARAKTWDQRTALRAGELEALTHALAILEDKVKATDAAVNARALLQRAGGAPPARASAGISFAQLRSVTRHHSVFNTEAAEVHSVSTVGRRERVASELLQREGLRLGSPALSALSAKVTADPFTKVKGLIQGLIERLLKESTEEATKKGFCDTEVGKASQNRDNRVADTKKLSAEIGSLEAKKDTLEQRIADLKDGVNKTTIELDEATTQRSLDKATNLNTTAEARKGLEAVTEAIAILKEFYKTSAKAKVFLQASPVDEDAPAAGFEGAYKGQQEASTGILGLLDVIKSDFERTIRTTLKEEKQAAEEFVDFDRMSKASISEKSKGVELETEEHASVGASLTQKSADLQAAQDLLDTALKTIEDLKPMCIDNTMSYAERVQKREDEIAALKTALCHLDPDKVEEECK